MSGVKDETWKSTELWRFIENSQDSEAESVRTLLESVMPSVETVLSKGGTSSTDFTLHDEGHAFRVAQTMTKIVPHDVLSKLSIYELMLLLLSAYLHDIGMTPERKKVHEHYAYLLTGDARGLDAQARAEFQSWLDHQGSSIEPPLARGAPSREQLEQVELLTTHYCRFKHNDWSEGWVRQHLSKNRIAGYSHWLEDLILLCRSHHETYKDLVGSKFKPRKVGQPFRIVHLRYLACVLRISDVLEFDPKRTPDVIFRHRSVSEGSQIFWHKDHEISSEFSSEEIKVFARPSNAYVHKALEETVEQIDTELRICRKIADELHFSKIPQLQEDSPHRWDLPASSNASVEPSENTYEYINGAFRPNTERLLKLLSGVELYKDPLAAVRELLQNAFDSVRERIAYQRLEKSNPADPNLEKSLGSLHEVHLRFEVGEDNSTFKLICGDEGMGMTKTIISDSFLVSGTSKRQDILALERKCREAGVNLGRTGQFGIGALSYFMLADKLTIQTKRSQEAGDSEATGWAFETRGIEAFGELRTTKMSKVGTQLTLHLRSDIVGNEPSAWFSALEKYIRETLLYIPCRFTLSSSLTDCEPVVFEPGWFKDTNSFEPHVLDALKNVDWRHYSLTSNEMIDVLTVEARQELRQMQERQDAAYKQARDSLKWKVVEGTFGNNLGRYRVQIPYFDLASHLSLAYLKIRQEGQTDYMEYVKERDFIYFPDWQMDIGWKGVSTLSTGRNNRFYELALPVNNFFSAIVEVDTYSSDVGLLSVDRKGIELSQAFKLALRDLYKDLENMYDELLRENIKSKFALLNHILTTGSLPSVDDMKWIKGIRDPKHPEKRIAAWDGVSLPVVHYSRSIRGWGDEGNILSDFDEERLSWRGYEVSTFHSLSRSGRSANTWRTPEAVPDRIVEFTHKNTLFLAVLWTKQSIENSDLTTLMSIGQKCLFPMEWKKLAIVQLEDSGTSSLSFLNGDNNLVQMFDENRYRELRPTLSIAFDPLLSKDTILKDKFYSATWLLAYLAKSRGHEEWTYKSIWDALPQRDPRFLTSLWAMLGLDESTPIYVWHGEQQDGYLLEISPGVWNVHKDMAAIRQHLPEPSNEWKLQQTS